jgi:hypothetical protein
MSTYGYGVCSRIHCLAKRQVQENLSYFFVENDKLILTFIWIFKGLKIDSTTLKKNRLEDSHFLIPNLQQSNSNQA